MGLTGFVVVRLGGLLAGCVYLYAMSRGCWWFDCVVNCLIFLVGRIAFRAAWLRY